MVTEMQRTEKELVTRAVASTQRKLKQIRRSTSDE
jgi:hypothetical protein